MGIVTVLWEKWTEFKRDFFKITLAAMIAPLMYILVFGLGIQMMSHGQSYLSFLIPGVVALTSMTASFNAIAQNLNVQRLYERAFDQVMISPTPLWQFVAGQIIGGSLRGIYAAIVIMVLVLPIRTGVHFNWLTFVMLFLNGIVFSSIAVVVSFYAKTHTDAPRFSTYIIMPMSYLCNTFFALENVPKWMGYILKALPLTQTSTMVRAISAGEPVNYMGVVILLIYTVVFVSIAFLFLYKKKNL